MTPNDTPADFHESGVIIAGDEERPGSAGADADGGAIFKFLPSTLRTDSGFITNLDDSPLFDGTNYALQVSCVNNTQQFGQGCEVGRAAWVAVGAATARPDANAVGATGYYRPEDLQQDPSYTGPGVRFCVANTGNAGAGNYGEVLCAIDEQPTAATPGARTVVINRFLEGDTQLNQPDNLEFQPDSGVVYVIEDNAFGDVWACLPDGDDRDLKSDGCARVLSVKDRSAEPTGFKFHRTARRHTGFQTVSAETAASFGGDGAERLAADSRALFGFGLPLSSSAGN